MMRALQIAAVVIGLAGSALADCAIISTQFSHTQQKSPGNSFHRDTVSFELYWVGIQDPSNTWVTVNINGEFQAIWNLADMGGEGTTWDSYLFDDDPFTSAEDTANEYEIEIRVYDITNNDVSEASATLGH